MAAASNVETLLGAEQTRDNPDHADVVFCLADADLAPSGYCMSVHRTG
jgi:hypothetical protein